MVLPSLSRLKISRSAKDDGGRETIRGPITSYQNDMENCRHEDTAIQRNNKINRAKKDYLGCGLLSPALSQCEKRMSSIKNVQMLLAPNRFATMVGQFW
jgi:hypothetical protein